jgi:hypothetical protein
MHHPKPPPILQLDAEASAMLDLFVELGHLDEKLLATVNDHLLDLPMTSGKVTAEDVRRVVAQTVFDHLEDMDPEFRQMIDSEWGILFS